MKALLNQYKVLKEKELFELNGGYGGSSGCGTSRVNSHGGSGYGVTNSSLSYTRSSVTTSYSSRSYRH